MSNDGRKIKVAIAGVGNCASSLVQGVEFYRNGNRDDKKEHVGLMHYEIDGFKPEDIEVVAAFDIDKRKVGKPLHQALKAKPAPGRPPKLTQNEKQELEGLLLQGAEAAGFDTDLWTCPRVARLIRKHFGVRYHVDHIGRLLRSLGWSPQRLRAGAPPRTASSSDGLGSVAGRSSSARTASGSSASARGGWVRVSRAEITDKGWIDFQRWLKFQESRRYADSGGRRRDGERSKRHGRKATGSAAIRKELEERVPLALATLLRHADSDPQELLRYWDDELAKLVVRVEHKNVERHAVLGLWCQDDGCRQRAGRRRFIRPAAVLSTLVEHPALEPLTTAVCPTCGQVTVMWFSEAGPRVLGAPKLKTIVRPGFPPRPRSHPMDALAIVEWLGAKKGGPSAGREAPLITGPGVERMDPPV